MDRKEEILEAASSVFERYGLAKSTLEDVAKECGIKKTAIYYYFKNKEELFKTMFLKDIESIKEYIMQKVESESSTLKKIRTYMILRLKSLDKMRKYFDIFQGDNASVSYRDFAYGEKERSIHFEIESLTNMISKGVKKRELEVENIKSLAFIIMGATYGLTHEFLCFNNDIDTDKEVDKILDILLKGIELKSESNNEK